MFPQEPADQFILSIVQAVSEGSYIQYHDRVDAYVELLCE